MTSCSGTFEKFDDSKAYKKTETFSFAQASNGIDTLPSWVPAGATGIDEVIRTTGNERILRMTANIAEIDHNSCIARPTVETRPASLSAQWWPTGVEKGSSFSAAIGTSAKRTRSSTGTDRKLWASSSISSTRSSSLSAATTQ
ncbi:hypothetical protein ACETU7_24100 [Rhodococcus sp. 3Y1]